MTDEQLTFVRRRNFIGFRLATTASGLALAIGLAAAPAAAQTVVIGGTGDAVTVNTSVLDQLGPGGSPTYSGGAGNAEPGYGNFPPQQMPQSFSNLNNLAPQSSPGIRTTQSAPQPASSQTGQSGVPQAPQPSQAAAPQQPAPQGPEPTYTAAPQQPQGTSSSAGLTPTERLQQQGQGGSTQASGDASANQATAAASQPEDMSGDPAATRDEPLQAAPSSSTGAAQAAETEVAEAVESPPPPESAVPDSEPAPESAAEETQEQMEASEPASASGSETMTSDATTEETTAPAPPPAPEPPEAPASATPADDPPEDEPAENATAEASEPAVPEAEAAEETETAESGDGSDDGSGDDAATQDSQQAALTTGSGPMQGGTLRVIFATAESDLPEDAEAELKALAQKLLQEEGTRIQLLAYAGGDSSESSRARRLSLARALEVRGYLIDQGIRSTRMDVRALGNNVPDGPPDRVDIQAAVR